ncbi:MAG: hypothetical protein HY721_15185 [Planctomycetes bacterium]|nr:hypothetical protein [Planctomycetota bacterium]
MRHRGRTIALGTAILALVALGTALFVARDRVLTSLGAWWRGRSSLERAPDLKGKRVDISPGEIEVAEFLRFLGDYTGLPVIFDSNDPRIAKGKIILAAPMEDVDANIVIAVLEANGYRVKVDVLPGGKRTLRVEVAR